jgi:polyketide biosynthesis enoyl-CoA hydratase PksH
MEFQTLIVKDAVDSITIKLNRLDQQNSINMQMLNEIHIVLDSAEQRPECHMVVLEGNTDIFCAGMDFKEMSSFMLDPTQIHAWTAHYMATLKRLASIPKIIVTKVEGKVIAGGVGLVAASDYVIVTDTATFKLTEALWGLLPAMVAPYLVRRIGPHQAYSMALTCKTLIAEEAYRIHLADELNDKPEESIAKLLQRFSRLEDVTIRELKSYFRKMWIVNDNMDSMAIDTTTRLLLKPNVQAKIRNFIEHHKLPWEAS